MNHEFWSYIRCKSERNGVKLSLIGHLVAAWTVVYTAIPILLFKIICAYLYSHQSSLLNGNSNPFKVRVSSLADGVFGTSIKFVLGSNSYAGPFACLRVEIYGEPVPQPSGKSASSFCFHSTCQKSNSSAFLTHTAKMAGYVFNCKPVYFLFKQVFTIFIFTNSSSFYPQLQGTKS